MLSSYGLVTTRAKAVSVGDVFGRLTVLAVGQRPNSYYYAAICQCSCGGHPTAVKFYNLTSGQTVSCGCYHKERITSHGLTKSGHYSRWRNMMLRCYDPSCPAFPDYGGRGIRVCPEWHDITKFVAQLPTDYVVGMEMDRIDNDGHYEPSNIRWVTRQRNCTNRRSRRTITLNGQTQSITEWADELGIPYTAIKTRLDDLGWSVDRALAEPLADKTENMLRAQALRWAGHTKKPAPPPRILHRFPFDGKQMTIAEISAATGITIKLLRKRLCERGWSVERATIPVANQE